MLKNRCQEDQQKVTKFAKAGTPNSSETTFATFVSFCKPQDRSVDIPRPFVIRLPRRSVGLRRVIPPPAVALAKASHFNIFTGNRVVRSR
jgi:hypothetical protein